VVVSVSPVAPEVVREALMAAIPGAIRPLGSETMPNWANFLNMEGAYRARVFVADFNSLWVDVPMMRRSVEGMKTKPTFRLYGAGVDEIVVEEDNQVCLRERGNCLPIPGVG